MFNATVYKNESKVVAVTKEIERTISPDKVTEMYDKVHEEVEATILRKLHVEDNVMHGIIMECEDRYETLTKHIYLRFTLNGKEYTHKDEVKETFTDQELYEKLFKFYEDAVIKLLMQKTAPIITRI